MSDAKQAAASAIKGKFFVMFGAEIKQADAEEWAEAVLVAVKRDAEMAGLAKLDGETMP